MKTIYFYFLILLFKTSSLLALNFENKKHFIETLKTQNVDFNKIPKELKSFFEKNNFIDLENYIPSSQLCCDGWNKNKFEFTYNGSIEDIYKIFITKDMRVAWSGNNSEFEMAYRPELSKIL